MTLQTRKYLVPAILVAGLMVMAGLVAQATLSPAVVAVVDMERLFNNLVEKTDADNELKGLADDTQVKFDAVKKEAKALESQLLGYDVTSAKYGQISKELTEKLASLSAITELGKQRIVIRQARLMKRIYEHIRTDAGAYSKAQAIDVVLLDDTIPALEENTDILRQISARRLIFADKKLDITDQLLEYMNQRYSNSMAAAPSTGSPGKKP